VATVTVEYEPGEREAMNAEGLRQGCAACPSCGDSMLWKPFHYTPYATEITKGSHQSSVQLAIAILCESCWEKSSGDERAKFCEQRLAKRKVKLRSVTRLMVNEGQLVDDPKDRARYDAELAAIRSDHEDIVRSVRAEK